MGLLSRVTVGCCTHHTHTSRRLRFARHTFTLGRTRLPASRHAGHPPALSLYFISYFLVPFLATTRTPLMGCGSEIMTSGPDNGM